MNTFPLPELVLALAIFLTCSYVSLQVDRAPVKTLCAVSVCMALTWAFFYYLTH